MFYHRLWKNKDLSSIRGTSILEILVAASFSFILFIIIYINFIGSEGEVSVSNLAHDVSYGILKAQTYDVLGSAPLFINGKPKSYGLHFSMSDKRQYIFFADINGNGIYDSKTGSLQCVKNSECISLWKIANDNFVEDLCVENHCFSNKEIGVMDLVFIRPNPEPKVSGFLNGQNQKIYKGYSSRIKITDGQGSERFINVEPTGRISIE